MFYDVCAELAHFISLQILYKTICNGTNILTRVNMLNGKHVNI